LGRRVVGVSVRAQSQRTPVPTTWVVGLLACKSMAEPLRVPRPWALGRHTAKVSDSSLGKAVVG
jgi:hypothetical protein